jgi:hypothetical protein
MKKLTSSLLGLIFAAVLLLLFSRAATVSAKVGIETDNFTQPHNLLAAETNHFILTSSDAFTVYLPLVHGPRTLSLKRGVGVFAAPACTDLANLKAAWYLNWRVSPDPTCGGANADKFVPRIYGANEMPLLAQAIANAQASGWLIGFSEPNLPWQGNMSPVQGAILWKQIENAAIPAGIKLVSPSPNQYNPGQADPYGYLWLWAMVDAYKSQNGGQSPHFDAIGWNIYKRTPGEIEAYLTARHNEGLTRGYDVPIWVLEYGGECWNSASGNTGNQSIMTMTTAWLDSIPWIGRYAWFANRIVGTEPGAPGWQSCTLINPSLGTLTALGQTYSTY